MASAGSGGHYFGEVVASAGPGGHYFGEVVASTLDYMDILYVRDCGRAIAQLMTASRLSYDTYNIGSGGTVSNAEAAAAIRRVVPAADLPLRDGRSQFGGRAEQFMDITRLREDTGFTPGFTLDEAVADYIAWLRAGHDR